MSRVTASTLAVAALAAAILAVGPLTGEARADSIFDIKGTGQDVVPVSGGSRCLGGAVAATDDPLSVAVMNPYASAFSDRVILTIGFVHSGTETNNLGEEKTTASSIFPTVAMTVPIKGISFMTGIFLERGGRLSLADTGTAYVDEPYDVAYEKEVSAQSVPLYASKELFDRLVLSGGFIYSAFDSKWTNKIDFKSDELTNTDDAIDLSSSGVSYAFGGMLDLHRVRLAGLYRGKGDLSGRLDRDSKEGGVWSSEDVTVTSEASFKIGIWARPLQSLVLEADYDRSPWSLMEVNGVQLSDRRSERWSVGLEYRGDHLWDASRYPLCIGYFEQPIDWESELTGEITHQVISVGTYFRMGGDRAGFSAALEFGQKEASGNPDLHERTIGLSLSLSAIEAWRREVRR